jgi:hypothetical protein
MEQGLGWILNMVKYISVQKLKNAKIYNASGNSVIAWG